MEYRNNFLYFYSFLRDDYTNSNHFMIVDIIRDLETKSFFFNRMVFDKRYLSQWNLNILKQIVHFWDFNGNYENLLYEYRKIQEKQHTKSDKFAITYFKINKFYGNVDKKRFSDIEKIYNRFEAVNYEEPEFADNNTYFEVLFFSEHIPFYIKKILRNWVEKINNKFEMLFFNIGMDNEMEEIELIMFQDYLNNSGIYKNIHFHHRISSSNATININNVKADYLSEVDDLQYFNLEENFKRVEDEFEEINSEEEFQMFGSLYFSLNSKQDYILHEFMSFMNELGMTVIKIEKDKFLNYKSYNVLPPHSLFKLNLQD